MAAFDGLAFSRSAFSPLAFSMTGGNPDQTSFPQMERQILLHKQIGFNSCVHDKVSVTVEVSLMNCQNVGL